MRHLPRTQPSPRCLNESPFDAPHDSWAEETMMSGSDSSAR